MLNPFPGVCQVLWFLLRRTAGAMAGAFACRIWIETMFMGDLKRALGSTACPQGPEGTVLEHP